MRRNERAIQPDTCPVERPDSISTTSPLVFGHERKYWWRDYARTRNLCQSHARENGISSLPKIPLHFRSSRSKLTCHVLYHRLRGLWDFLLGATLCQGDGPVNLT